MNKTEKKKDITESEPESANKYKIVKIETAKHNIPQRKCAKENIMPRYPFSMILSGPSGSGKTNLLINILSNEHLYKDYFHYILVFSPTAGVLDDTYNSLNIPEENFIKKMDATILKKIIDKRFEQIKKQGIEKVAKSSRMLLILDDVIADKKFLQSPEALVLFTLLRHYLISVIILVQAYNAVNRKCRNSANAVACFPSKLSEVETLKDEITPSGMKKKEFEKVIDYCDKDDHSFLFINNHAPKKEKIRCNLDEILTMEKMMEIQNMNVKKKTYEDDT